MVVGKRTAWSAVQMRAVQSKRERMRKQHYADDRNEKDLASYTYSKWHCWFEGWAGRAPMISKRTSNFTEIAQNDVSISANSRQPWGQNQQNAALRCANRIKPPTGGRQQKGLQGISVDWGRPPRPVFCEAPMFGPVGACATAVAQANTPARAVDTKICQD